MLILPMAGPNLHVTQFNFDELAFLFDSEDPNLLGRLAVLQQEVSSTIDVIIQRSQLHADTLQPAVEKLEAQIGETIQLPQIENSLGKRITQILKMLTDSMVDGVDGVILSSGNHVDEMNKILKGKFAGHKVIGMIKPGKSTQPTQKSIVTDDV